MFIAAKRRHTIAHGVSREFLLSFHDDDPTRLYLRRRAGGLSAQRGNVKVWCGVVVPKVRTFLCWKVASRAWIRETRAEAVQIAMTRLSLKFQTRCCLRQGVSGLRMLFLR